MISRRQCLAGLGAAILAPAIVARDSLPGYAQGLDLAALPGLRETAARKGILYGAAVRGDLLSRDPAYRAAVVKECGILVAENAMKFKPIRPTEKGWAFDEADATLAFAEANGMKVRGHTLIWHAALPDWAKATLASGGGAALLEQQIRTVMGRYRGRVLAWDVVNEILEPKDGLIDGLRKSDWYLALGPGYIDRAFRIARETDPGCQLVYNEWGHESYGTRPETILRYLEKLKKGGTPIDAVGMQSHLHTRWNVNARQLTWFCKSAVDLGLEILVTELDGDDSELPDDIQARDQGVHDRVRAFLEAVAAATVPRQVLTWGLSDRYSFMNAPGRREPGSRAKRPLPLDEAMRRKPAWLALHNFFTGL